MSESPHDGHQARGRSGEAVESLDHRWARFSGILDANESVDDPAVAIERLGILNAIIAASSGAASFSEMLERILDAICARYPGLAGAVARYEPAVAETGCGTGEVTIASERPAAHGDANWPDLFAPMPDWVAGYGGGFEPRLLSRDGRVALVMLIKPWGTAHHAIAFADVDNVVRLPNSVLAVIALECNYVLDREVATQQLKEREAQFRAVFDASPIAQALMWGDRREFAVVNDALCRLVGYTREDLVGRSARSVTHPFDIPTIEKARDLAALDPAGQYRVPRRMIRSDGEIVYTETTLTWITMPDRRRMLLQQIADVTAQRRAESDLIEQSETDSLTGIGNRRALVRRISEWGEAGSEFGVIFLDVDSFKSINDARGHDVGDEILIEVARRLTAVAGPADLVVRFGGDEFVVVCRGGEYDDPAGAGPGAFTGARAPTADARLGAGTGVVPGGAPTSTLARAVRDCADRVQAALSSPIETSSGAAHVTVSIGICDDTVPVTRPIDRLQYADTAAYRAKRLGEDRQVVYDHGLHRQSTEYQRIESLLRTAVEDGRFVMHYQPIVDVADGAPLGVEALVRMRDRSGHLVPPGDFIEVAERSGLIVPMGAWVMRESCRQIAEINRTLHTDLHVSVNIAARQAARADLVDVAHSALADAGLPPRALTLELTESALLEADEATLARLTELRAAGVQIALDDFGTGYSSLTYLRKLPVTRIKVDRSFVDTMTTDPDCAAIVKAVTTLASDLGLAWVAEGVETAQQWAALRLLGPGLAQGFYFARPQPESMLAHTLAHALRHE